MQRAYPENVLFRAVRPRHLPACAPFQTWPRSSASNFPKACINRGIREDFFRIWVNGREKAICKSVWTVGIEE